MSKYKYFVCGSGTEAQHKLVESYNSAVSRYAELESNLQTALNWNQRERFGTGLFAQTKPPTDIGPFQAALCRLESKLEQARAEIEAIGTFYTQLSGGLSEGRRHGTSSAAQAPSDAGEAD